MGKYIFGLILITVGVIVIWKTSWFIQNFGRSNWAETKIGAGGTWTFYKIIGVAAILLAFLIMSGKVYTVLDVFFARG